MAIGPQPTPFQPEPPPEGPITGVGLGQGTLPFAINIPGLGVVGVDWIVVGQAVDASNRSVLVVAPTPSFAELTPQQAAFLFNSMVAVDEESGQQLDPIDATPVIAQASSILTGRGLTPSDVFQQISQRSFVDMLLEAGLNENLLQEERALELIARSLTFAQGGINIPLEALLHDIPAAVENPEFRSPLIEGGQPLPGEFGTPPIPPGATMAGQVEIARALQSLRGMTFETEEERRQATRDLLGPLLTRQVGEVSGPVRGEAVRSLIESLPQGAERRRFESAFTELVAAGTGRPLRLTAPAGEISLGEAEDIAANVRAKAQAVQRPTAAEFEELTRRSRARAQRRAAI